MLRFFLIIFLFYFFAFTAQARSIKILLHEALTKLYITANQDYQIIDLSKDKSSILLNKNQGFATLLRSSPATANNLLIAASPDLVTINSPIKFLCQNSKDQLKACLWEIKPSQEGSFENKQFRGSIIVIPHENYFQVINELDIEDYLLSVLPSEMISSWPQEALKAQAVAARTYTYKNLGKYKYLAYDLKSDVSDQMYRGYKAEDPNTNKAVKSTGQELLVDKSGALIEAYYSSHAGRFTAQPENGWGISPRHYLIHQLETSDNQYSWSIEKTFAQLNQDLSDLGLSQITAITVAKRGPDHRVLQIILSSPQHNISLTGEEFRHKLRLRSTDFDLIFNKNKITISGRGFGHGIGLSQYGARQMALDGKNYAQILEYFYSGAKLFKFDAYTDKF